MASAYSHCAVGVVSAAVFAVSPAISASHRFDCVLFTITQNSVGGAVLALEEPIIHVGKSSQEGWEGEPLTSWPGLQPQGSKILSGKAYLGDVLRGIPSALILILIIIIRRTRTFIKASPDVPEIILSALRISLKLILTTTL